MKEYKIIAIGRASAHYEKRKEYIGKIIKVKKIESGLGEGFVSVTFSIKGRTLLFCNSMKVRKVRARKAIKKKGKSKRFTATS